MFTFSAHCFGSKHSPVQPKVLWRADLRAIQQQAAPTRQPRALHHPSVCARGHGLHIWKAQLDHRGGPGQRLVHWSGCRINQKKECRLPQPIWRILGDWPVQRRHVLGSDLASRQAFIEAKAWEDYCQTGLWQRKGSFHQPCWLSHHTHIQWQVYREALPLLVPRIVSRGENLQPTDNLSSENYSRCRVASHKTLWQIVIQLLQVTTMTEMFEMKYWGFCIRQGLQLGTETDRVWFDDEGLFCCFVCWASSPLHSQCKHFTSNGGGHSSSWIYDTIHKWCEFAIH